MAGTITYFTVENFAEQAVFSDSDLKCTINNIVFRKGDIFANLEIKKVIDTCKKYNNFGVNTLIVKKDKELTIWIEERVLANNKSDNLQKDGNHAASTQPQTNQSLYTKTVIKKYRGREYEETVVDWATVRQLQQTNQQKPRRKYRGQYID